jgi:hypothetical protein
MLAVSYRFAASPETAFDVFAGARFANIDQSLDWQFTGSFGAVVPPPLMGSRDASVDVWDGIVGVRGRFALGAGGHWVVPLYLDIGTGDSDLTWQSALGLGYAFGWGNVGVAWRYLRYEMKSDAPVSDLSLNGPALGVTFRW